MSNTHIGTRIAVLVLFLAIYGAFLWETAALMQEFGPSGLALRLASLDSQNFIFFPIAGLLALVAFWKPVVLLVDASWRGKLRFGRPVMIVAPLVCAALAAMVAAAFQSSPARSMYEIAPDALVADVGTTATASSSARAPVPEILARMKILSGLEGGLSRYQTQCDPEWLKFSTAADEELLCFPAGESISVRACCQAKAALRDQLNVMAKASPSRLAAVHAIVLPVKIFFLLLLLVTGILLVQYRKGLEKIHAGQLGDVSFGLALGGAVMLIWPLLNASYLETMALLTGGTSSSAYTVFAPLVALGFGAWTMLLIFFHLRSYPSQIEYAAKVGGFIAAAIGVFRYEEITMYLSRTLGIGGGVVTIVVFGVAVLGMMISILLGIDPKDINFDGDGEEDGSN